MASYDDEDGVWRTIGGRRIFIKGGEDLASAMKRSGKFKSVKNKDEKQERYNKLSPEDQKIADKEEYEANKQMLKEMERRLHRKDLTDEQREKYEDEAGNYEAAIHDYESRQNTSSSNKSDLASERSKQYSDIEKASGLKIDKSYQTDAFGNGDEDHFELSDGRTVVHSRESLGKKEDSWSIEEVKNGSINSQNFKSYEEMIDHLKGGSGGSDKPYSEKEMMKELTKPSRDTTGVDFDWKASDEKLERLDKEIDTLDKKANKISNRDERLKSDESRKSISKLIEKTEEDSEREVQKLKNYIRDNYDDPNDFLKDYDAQTEASLKGTKTEKFKDAKGYMDINEAIEARSRNNVERIVNELKKENEYNDKIIADYEKAKASGKADRVAERLGLKKSESNKTDFNDHDIQMTNRVYKEAMGDKKEFLRKMRQDYNWDNEDAKKYYDRIVSNESNNKTTNNSNKYNDYYKKENLGTPSNYQKGDNVEFNDGYYETISGKIVREATDQEKKYSMNQNLKGYVVQDKYGNEYIIPDTRIKQEGSTQNAAYKKAFDAYKKEHPNTKLTLNKFIKMSEGEE